jgi:hypothetical protein
MDLRTPQHPAELRDIPRPPDKERLHSSFCGGLEVDVRAVADGQALRGRDTDGVRHTAVDGRIGLDQPDVLKREDAVEQIAAPSRCCYS